MAKTSKDARTQARQMVATQNRRNKRNKNLIAAGIIAGVVLILSIIGFMMVQDAKKTGSDAKVSQGEQITPERATANGAFHIPSEGTAPEAPEDSTATRVDMFLDPQCPGCGAVERGIGDRIAELVEAEEIDLYVTPVSFLDRATTDRYSSRATNAIITVAEKTPENALDFIHAIYAEDVQPGETGGASGVSDDKLAEIAVSVGVPQDVADTFKNHSYFDWIKSNTETQQARTDLFATGFSTPSVFLNVEYVDGKGENFTKVPFQDEDVLKTFNETFENLKKGN